MITVNVIVIFLRLMFGFLGGYVLASLIESLMHQYVSDAPMRTVKKWMRFPRLCKYLIRTNYSHHTVHHRKTYKLNHVTQFVSDAERQALDAHLSAMGAHGEIILKSKYAVKLHGSGSLVFIAPLLPVVPLSYMLAGASATFGCCLALALPPLFSNYIHPFLHMPYEYALSSAPKWLKPFIKTRYFRAICVNHFMHHRYVVCNFNLVLGGDWLRGVSKRPSAQDVERMKVLGLPVNLYSEGKK